MANPQVEDGHTRIANELMEQLMKLYLAPNQWQVLVCIIRKTYGFHKKIDYLTNTQICDATGLLKANVSRVLKCLHQRNIITRNGKHVGLQKDWEQWLTWEEWQKLSVQTTKVINADNQHGEKSYQNEQPKLSILQPELSVQTTKVISPLVTQKKETIQKKLYKRKYGEFQNVVLTDDELAKLNQRFPSEMDSLIEQLSCYIRSKGKKYKSHYATLLSWYRMSKERKVGATRNPRELPTAYTRLPEQDEDE